MVIETENLQKRYDDTHALRGVDLQIEPGGIYGLLGPNGAGKTTLVEILEGLRQPTSGTARVLGMNPSQTPAELKQKIGVQLQKTSLPEDLSCLEILRTFAAFYKNALSPEEVLERVVLTEKATSQSGTLSGGQKQRLALGLALINDPEFIFLDEPTTGLDPVARRMLHDIVLDLKQQGRSILLTTHYIEEAEKLCDRVIMLRSGRIVADGSPFDLIGAAAGKSTIWVAVDGEFNAEPLLATGAEQLPGHGQYYKFSTSDPTSAVLALGEILKQQNLQILDLRLKRPTLEDVYLELVGKPEAGMTNAADDDNLN